MLLNRESFYFSRTLAATGNQKLLRTFRRAAMHCIVPTCSPGSKRDLVRWLDRCFRPVGGRKGRKLPASFQFSDKTERIRSFTEM
jgi:hypothetical protein